jgi:tetratricopeptide (TPR) repeat protein
LANRTREKYPDCSVFWVLATSIENIEEAYREIGRRLQIPGLVDEKADVKKLVQQYLSQESAGQWLMIVDNADDIHIWLKLIDNSAQPTALLDYLPRSSKGSVVFTTRNRKAAVKMAQNNVIEVFEMGEDVATQLLKKSMVRPEIQNNHSAASALLNQLTCLPLAIVQAAAYMNENDLSIPDYLSLLKDTEENVTELLSEDFEDDRRYRELKNPVATTWLISFEQIRYRDPLAAVYLSFMSCLDPKSIPQTLLPPEQSKKKIVDAIGTLTAYSFITKRQIDQSFDLHRLVHLATRNWLRSEDLLAVWTEKAVARLAEVFPDCDHKNKPIWTSYLPHARYILASDLAHEDARERFVLLEKVGRCLLADGKYNEAEEMQGMVLGWREKTLGLAHADTLKSVNNLAKALLRVGKYTEAEIMMGRALEERRRMLGPEHPDTLSSMANLA